jgi:predicted enzyme related to lactoylglutathione lyase
MGFTVIWGEENGTYADFDVNEHLLALFEKAPMAEAIGAQSPESKSEQQDNICLIFAVDDVDDTYDLLKKKGVVPINMPHDRKEWGIRCFHFRDPAGNLIEINKEIGMSG